MPPKRSGKLYHLRNRVAGGLGLYNTPEDCVEFGYYALLEKGVLPEQIYVSEMAPTEKTVLQGEVMRVPGGLYLYYSTLVAPMRDALAAGAQSARGIIALELLRGAMDANSCDWLWELLERYPDHVVEFSCYSTQWGSLSGFNTVFWEVRLY